MKVFSIQTGFVISILLLTHLNVFAASSKERALRLNAEINHAADERDASFKDAEKKARQAIREREEKLKRLKYEDPDEISSNTTASSDEKTVQADAGEQNEASKDENRLPASESKATPIAEEPTPVVVPEEATPEASQALISETVDKKAVENELQNYEGFATEEETVAETSVPAETATEASEAPASEETHTLAEGSSAKQEIEQGLTEVIQEVKKSKKAKSVKAEKKYKKSVAQKNKDKKSLAQKSSKEKKKVAKSQKSKKESKLASNSSSKKKSSLKITKSNSSKKVSRAPASFSSK